MAQKSRESAFTLVELLIVCAVMTLLIGFLVPILWGLISKSQKTADSTQVKLLNQACEAYASSMSFAPGYFEETYLEQDAVYQDFTSTENLVVSLMGGVSNAGASEWTDLDTGLIGRGAYTNGGFAGSFYTPRAGELKQVKGTTGNDNQFPEITTISTGVPLLYWRARGEDYNYNDRQSVSWTSSGKGAFIRKVNDDYLGANALAGKYDQRNESVISQYLTYGPSGQTGSDYADSQWYGPNNNLAWLVVDRKDHRVWGNTKSVHAGWPSHNGANAKFIAKYGGSKGVMRHGWFFMGAGADGIYLSRENARTFNNSHGIWDIRVTEDKWAGQSLKEVFDIDEGMYPNTLCSVWWSKYKSGQVVLNNNFRDSAGNPQHAGWQYNWTQVKYSNQAMHWERFEHFDDIMQAGGDLPESQ